MGGAIHRIVQGCFSDDGIVLSILELRLEVVVSGWWTGLLQTAIARVEQPLETKGEEMAAAGQAAIPSVGGFEVVT